MTNAELADYLNDRLALIGKEAVSTNVIRQWIAWDVLPKATAQGKSIGKGPDWSRSNAAMHRAMRLAQLRRYRINRKSTLIVQAYIEWGHNDFDGVRRALFDEWGKWAAQLSRRQITFTENAEFQKLSVTKQRAIANQIGPLDELFIGTPFQQSPELYGTLAEFARLGEGNLAHLEMLISAVLCQILPGISSNIPASWISLIANSISGMTGSPDEIDNSGGSVIQNSSERQFRLARYQIRILLKELSNGERHGQSAALGSGGRQLWQILSQIAPQISTGPWLTYLYVQATKSTVSK